jgi:hypothetical protein
VSPVLPGLAVAVALAVPFLGGGFGGATTVSWKTTYAVIRFMKSAANAAQS